MTLASSANAMPGFSCLPAGQAAGYAAADAVQVRCSQPWVNVPCSVCIAAAAGSIAATDAVSFTCSCTYCGRCDICLDVMMIAHISVIVQHACHMILSDTQRQSHSSLTSVKAPVLLLLLCLCLLSTLDMHRLFGTSVTMLPDC